jgi:SNF family Na+-dependent transporter
MNNRLGGVGMACLFGSYVTSFYYTVLISWSLVYVVSGFSNPLPWSKDNNDEVWACDSSKITRAEEFFYKKIVTYYDDNC